MRRMFQVQMPGVPPAVQDVFNQIFRASAEADVVDIGAEYDVNGAFTETRILNVTAPTTANIAAVLATLLSDLKNGGAKKST